MKKSELRQLIKEEIEKILDDTEQPSKIMADVYYIEETPDGEFEQEAVPEYELKNAGYSIKYLLKFNKNNFLYIPKNTEGTYYKDEESFETEEGSSTRIKPQYIQKIT
jgi:hypothetical protein